MEENVWKDEQGRPELIASPEFLGMSAPMVRFTDPDRDKAAHENEEG